MKTALSRKPTTTMSTTDNAALGSVSVKDVRIDYSVNSVAFTAVRSVSVEVPAGKMLCVIGPSGCGKTTLLHAIAGLIPYAAGEIAISGRRISGPGKDRAVVFQQPALLPWKTVLANVAFGLKLYGEPKQSAQAQAKTMIDLVGLASFEERFPYQLSGGMQQRANLARALAANPEILLFDEPFAALDAQQRDLLQTELLRIWQSTTKTGIFITHQIDEAVLLGDQVLILSKGPGSVVSKLIDIDLPRPRDVTTRLNPKFEQHVQEIREQIAH